MNKIDAVEIIGKLREKGTSLEEIAFKMGLSFNTVYNYAKGNKLCSLSNFALLQKLLDEKESNKES